MRPLVLLGVTLGALVTLAPACANRDPGLVTPTTGDAAARDATASALDAAEPEDAGPEIVGVADAGPIRVVDGGSAVCANATPIPTDGEAHRVDLDTTTSAGAPFAVPCATDVGAPAFFDFVFSRPMIVYADTFGTPFDTVVFLLDRDCAALAAPTEPGTATCSNDACDTKQSQIVARVEPGRYRLGIAGRAGAVGHAFVHFAWAFAPSGTMTRVGAGATSFTGATLGTGGNTTALSSKCLAAGAEDAYWWASCPNDPGGMLTASTCEGTTWESVVALSAPGMTPYACNRGACGLQASLAASVPAGAGLRVLAVDGESSADFGAYTLKVTRP